MAAWKALFASYSTTGSPQRATEIYTTKEIAEEHARFLLDVLQEDVDYAGFIAFIIPPQDEGTPYWYIDDRE